jgi:hypothetical protein
MPWKRAIGALSTWLKTTSSVLAAAATCAMAKMILQNVHGCFSAGPDERLDRVCVGWLEVGSICSDIIIAVLRSATTAGSSSCILLEACPVCSRLLL